MCRLGRCLTLMLLFVTEVPLAAGTVECHASNLVYDVTIEMRGAGNDQQTGRTYRFEMKQGDSVKKDYDDYVDVPIEGDDNTLRPAEVKGTRIGTGVFISLNNLCPTGKYIQIQGEIHIRDVERWETAVGSTSRVPITTHSEFRGLLHCEPTKSRTYYIGTVPLLTLRVSRTPMSEGTSEKSAVEKIK